MNHAHAEVGKNIKNAVYKSDHLIIDIKLSFRWLFHFI